MKKNDGVFRSSIFRNELFSPPTRTVTEVDIVTGMIADEGAHYLVETVK